MALLVVAACRGSGLGEAGATPTEPVFEVTAPHILDSVTTTSLATTTIAVPAPDGLWAEIAIEHRGRDGERFTYECPPGGEVGAVWGTGTYTDDSSVCTAAVHAGLITLADGGAVTIEIGGAQGSFPGSEANGISSADWGYWEGSYRFVTEAP
jgi:hypothetical protein